MYRFSLKIIAPLIFAMVTYAPFMFADEQAGHGQAQEGHEHTAGGGTLTPSEHTHTPAGVESIEEIIVTADPLGDVEGHMMRPVQVLAKEELKARSIRNIGETVANELGVSSSDFGAAAGRPVIRGLAGSRVSVMENGISTLDVANMSADHAVPTEPAFARQVEIFRGPATLLYGSGASGGVINVVNDRILKYIPETLEGDMAIQYETVSDGVNGMGSFNIGTGNFAVHLDGMKRNTDDYDVPGYAELDADEGEMERGVLENSSIETENVSGGISWIGRRGFIGFSVSRLDSNYGIPGSHFHGGEGEEDHHDEEGEEDHDEEEGEEDHDEEEGEEDHDEEEGEEEDHHEEEGEEGHGGEGGARIDLGQTRYDLEADIDEPFPGIHRIRTRWTYNDYNHNELEASGEVGTAFDNDEVEGRVEIIHHPIGIWQGAFGLHYRNKDFAAVGEESFVLPSKKETIAAFLLEKGDLGNWHTEFGARYEYQETSADTGEETSHDLFSVSGGVSWDYAEGYEVGLAVTHAQRAPALEELYADGPHLATTTFNIGDTGLGKEKSTNFDFFWHKTAGKLTLTANLFYNRIDDFIFLKEQDLNGDGFADRVEEDFDGDPADILDPEEDGEPLLVVQSQDDADFMGFELEGVAHVLEGDTGVLDLRLWVDYVEGERSNGINLPRITPWRFGAGLTYSGDPWYASVSYTRVNKQDDTAPLETATSGYDVLNLYASYRLSKGDNDVTLFASATNLLDDESRRHTSFAKEQAPLPGRSGIFGLRVSF